MSFFDYLYFRITKLYFFYDGEIGSTAIAIVTFFQGLVLANLFMIVRLILEDFFLNIDKKYIGPL